MLKKKKPVNCSFCGKSVDQVEKIIQGPSVHICNECVVLCNGVLDDEHNDESEEVVEDVWSRRG